MVKWGWGRGWDQSLSPSSFHIFCGKGEQSLICIKTQAVLYNQEQRHSHAITHRANWTNEVYNWMHVETYSYQLFWPLYTHSFLFPSSEGLNRASLTKLPPKCWWVTLSSQRGPCPASLLPLSPCSAAIPLDDNAVSGALASSRTSAFIALLVFFWPHSKYRLLCLRWKGFQRKRHHTKMSLMLRFGFFLLDRNAWQFDFLPQRPAFC